MSVCGVPLLSCISFIKLLHLITLMDPEALSVYLMSNISIVPMLDQQGVFDYSDFHKFLIRYCAILINQLANLVVKL